MILHFLVYIGVLTIPIWAIVCCLNLVAIIKKVNAKQDHTLHTFWFTTSFVIIITLFAIIMTAIPSYS